MKWSPQQDTALRRVAEWFKHDSDEKQVFRFFGYAGTGKTTLAKHFAENIDGTVLFGAYTGKAALVLQRKGCFGASTIHKLLYQPKDKSKARLRELEAMLAEIMAEEGVDPTRKRRADEIKELIAQELKNIQRPIFAVNPDSPIKNASLLVVDECSMVDEQMGQDIESFGVPILVLGDPAQLPPVFGGGYFTAHKPDVMLTEIHRQARDNPILELSRIVREGGRLQPGTYGNSRVLPSPRAMTPAEALEADQLLVGRNRTRRATNARVRSLQGRQGDYPERGDRLVCLRNDHEAGLLNGGLWNVRDVEAVDPGEGRVVFSLDSADGEDTYLPEVVAHSGPFVGQEVPWYEKKDAQEFDYGYALTVHKSQGSQWNNVMLFDEWSGDSRKEWLYTGITRAAEQITVVQMV